ncbi:hypothetical protein EDD85DRAFT_972550 [Armillaria nabsnona]|nr:hypothetical protein EDD85DRAFT_972550 [Armillaria nabsnona]
MPNLLVRWMKIHDGGALQKRRLGVSRNRLSSCYHKELARILFAYNRKATFHCPGCEIWVFVHVTGLLDLFGTTPRRDHDLRSEYPAEADQESELVRLLSRALTETSPRLSIIVFGSSSTAYKVIAPHEGTMYRLAPRRMLHERAYRAEGSLVLLRKMNPFWNWGLRYACFDWTLTCPMLATSRKRSSFREVARQRFSKVLRTLRRTQAQNSSTMMSRVTSVYSCYIVASWRTVNVNESIPAWIACHAVLFEPNTAANRNESVQGKDAPMRSHAQAHDTVKTEDIGISGGPTSPLHH